MIVGVIVKFVQLNLRLIYGPDTALALIMAYELTGPDSLTAKFLSAGDQNRGRSIVISRFASD